MGMILENAEKIAEVNATMANAEKVLAQAYAEIIKVRGQRDCLLAALQGVLRVADRQTIEFDAARAAIAKATRP